MIESITAYRLAVPLTRPYRLAFGAVEHYDTLIVEAISHDGRRGYGEATVLTGYTDETIEDCWRVARAMTQELTGSNPKNARLRLEALSATHPFTATAFGTAFEMIENNSRFAIKENTAIPLVGLLDAKNEADMHVEVERLLAAGYRTLKFKVGFDLDGDITKVIMAQRIVRGRAAIRIDANQGYNAEQGIAFVSALDPEGIELFEQPCAAGDWESHLAVAKAATVPLMLDESIYGIADIEKAASLRCAAYIKVKLMKLVTMDSLTQALARIRELGMEPVLGNGVACDLGCWLEGVVAAGHIENAGELNGFLKAKTHLLAEPLTFADGALQLKAGYVPRLHADNIARHRIDSVTCTTGSVSRKKTV